MLNPSSANSASSCLSSRWRWSLSWLHRTSKPPRTRHHHSRQTRKGGPPRAMIAPKRSGESRLPCQIPFVCGTAVTPSPTATLRVEDAEPEHRLPGLMQGAGENTCLPDAKSRFDRDDTTATYGAFKLTCSVVSFGKAKLHRGSPLVVVWDSVPMGSPPTRAVTSSLMLWPDNAFRMSSLISQVGIPQSRANCTTRRMVAISSTPWRPCRAQWRASPRTWFPPLSNSCDAHLRRVELNVMGRVSPHSSGAGTLGSRTPLSIVSDMRAPSGPVLLLFAHARDGGVLGRRRAPIVGRLADAVATPCGFPRAGACARLSNPTSLPVQLVVCSMLGAPACVVWPRLSRLLSLGVLRRRFVLLCGVA